MQRWRQQGFRVAIAMLLAGVLVACTTPGPRERQASRLDMVTQAAGEPVEAFRFWNLHRWEPLGPHSVAVWTRFDEAYLVDVDRGCFGLEFAQAIGVTSSLNRVTRRFDAVTFERQRCAIEQIRPIDTVELRRLAAR
jgi:hypothetical protein